MTPLQNLLTMHVRAIGHTHAAIEVAKKSKGILVVDSALQAQQIMQDNPGLRVVFVSQLSDPSRLAGFRCPIITDHQALTSLLQIETNRLEEVKVKMRTLEWALGKKDAQFQKWVDGFNKLAAKHDRLKKRFKRLKERKL